MHPPITSRPAKLDASNAVFCCYCSQPLAVTVNGKCIGIKGIRAVIDEESRCPGTTVKLVTPRKKKGMLFAKGE